MTECVQQMLSYLFVNWSRKMFNPSGAQWMVFLERWRNVDIAGRLGGNHPSQNLAMSYRL